ncbi:MAG TPA: hypothetical protein VFS04_05320 [Alphaproteobacteria bacterium]|nr:hypothetical protein [Alphaproteobacteria bacterium]
MQNFFAGALGALALTATLSGAANAAPLNSKPEPAMTTIYSQQAATDQPDHANSTRPGAGRGFIVAAGVEHGPTVAGEQPDQNMYNAN